MGRGWLLQFSASIWLKIGSISVRAPGLARKIKMAVFACPYLRARISRLPPDEANYYLLQITVSMLKQMPLNAILLVPVPVQLKLFNYYVLYADNFHSSPGSPDAWKIESLAHTKYNNTSGVARGRGGEGGRPNWGWLARMC